MKLLCVISALIILAWLPATGLSQQPEPCPQGLVCISPEAARKALQDSDTVQAQAKEITAKDQAIADLQKELANLRIELAKMSGEKTGAEQMVVRLTAIVDILLKNSRPKKIGLINF